MRYRGLTAITHDTTGGATRCGEMRAQTPCASDGDLPWDSGWHKRLLTIPRRATKPSLIITAPDREKYRQGTFSLSTCHSRAWQPARRHQWWHSKLEMRWEGK